MTPDPQALIAEARALCDKDEFRFRVSEIAMIRELADALEAAPNADELRRVRVALGMAAEYAESADELIRGEGLADEEDHEDARARVAAWRELAAIGEETSDAIIGRRDMPTKGETLRRLRSLHSISMAAMAERIGVSVGVVSDWERDIGAIVPAAEERYLLAICERLARKRSEEPAR